MDAKYTTISVTKETLQKLRKLAKNKFEVPVSVQTIITWLIDKNEK
tara:strand:+ start:9311 stop:9448 length:138 start_codon:yes stop_codon:yes gene_type:complete